MNKKIYTLVLILISGMWFSLPAVASEKYTHTRYQVTDHRVMPDSSFGHYRARPHQNRRHHDYGKDDWRDERRHFTRHHRAKHWGHPGFRKKSHGRHYKDRWSRHFRKYGERHYDEGLKIGIYYEGFL